MTDKEISTKSSKKITISEINDKLKKGIKEKDNENSSVEIIEKKETNIESCNSNNEIELEETKVGVGKFISESVELVNQEDIDKGMEKIAIDMVKEIINIKAIMKLAGVSEKQLKDFKK